MRLILFLALAVVALMVVPSSAAAQYCEGCGLGECVREREPASCANWYKVNSCSCYPYCDCTEGTECPYCGSGSLVSNDLGHTKELLEGGWEISGVRLSDEAFSVLAACGAQVDVVYTAMGEDRRRELARSINFSSVERSTMVDRLSRAVGDGLDWL
jgi:hypothetical protein